MGELIIQHILLTVIASEAKQSPAMMGLLRRYAPRNDMPFMQLLRKA
jgi:hypothetical protein